MTENQIEAILSKLDRQHDRLDNIEKAISAMAVQDERILNLQSKVTALWEKYDIIAGPEGTVAKMKANQARCPENRVTALESRFWGLLISIGLIYLSGLGGVLVFVFKSHP